MIKTDFFTVFIVAVFILRLLRRMSRSEKDSDF